MSCSEIYVTDKGNIYGIDKENKPKLLMKNKNVVQIESCNTHALILTDQGEIYVWGDNYRCQLGLPKVRCVSELTLLVKDVNICKIYCFYDNSIYYKNDGQIYIFGKIFWENGKKPKYLVTIPNAVSILRYDHIIYILKNNGEILECSLYNPKANNVIHKNEKIIKLFNSSYAGCNDTLIFGLTIDNDIVVIQKKINGFVKCIYAYKFSMESQIKNIIFDANPWCLSLSSTKYDWIIRLLVLNNSNEVYDIKFSYLSNLCNDNDACEIIDLQNYVPQIKGIAQIGHHYGNDIFINNKQIIIRNNYKRFANISYKNIEILYEDNITSISNCSIFHWTPTSHKFFSVHFKKTIYSFLCCLKRIQCETKIKIPKFVLFEIIKFTI